MSYHEEVIGTCTTVLDQVYEYRKLFVTTGDPAPTPAPGYAVTLMASNVYGKDVYEEYRFLEREQ